MRALSTFSKLILAICCATALPALSAGADPLMRRASIGAEMSPFHFAVGPCATVYIADAIGIGGCFRDPISKEALSESTEFSLSATKMMKQWGSREDLLAHRGGIQQFRFGAKLSYLDGDITFLDTQHIEGFNTSLRWEGLLLFPNNHVGFGFYLDAGASFVKSTYEDEPESSESKVLPHFATGISLFFR